MGDRWEIEGDRWDIEGGRREGIGGGGGRRGEEGGGWDVEGGGRDVERHHPMNSETVSLYCVYSPRPPPPKKSPLKAFIHHSFAK